MTNDFYVYKHIRLDTNTCFYVGKGYKNRAKVKITRNTYWKNIVAKHDYRVEFVAKGLSEKDALALEQKLIAIYRRHGRCEANLTSGGEGTTLSEETKRKMSESRKGKSYPHMKGRIPPNKGKKGLQRAWNKGKKGTYKNPKTVEYWKTHQKNSPPNKGTTWSDSERAGIAKGKNLKPFQVIEQATGQVVWTGLWQTEAIKFLGLTLSSKGNINMCLNNLRKSHKNFLFQYLSDDSQTPVAS